MISPLFFIALYHNKYKFTNYIQGGIRMPRINETKAEYECRLREQFNKELLTPKEVSAFCGIDWRTAKSLFNFTHNYISVGNLAKRLSEIGA